MKGLNILFSLHWYLAIIYNPGAVLEDTMETETDIPEQLGGNESDEPCDLLQETTMEGKKTPVLLEDDEDQLKYESCEENRFETISIGLSNDIQFMPTPEGKNHKAEELAVSPIKQEREIVDLDSDVETDLPSTQVDEPKALQHDGSAETLDFPETISLVHIDDDDTMEREPSKPEASLPSVRDMSAERPLRVYGKHPKTGKTVLRHGTKANPKSVKNLEAELAQKRKTCHIMILDSLNISRSVCIRNLKEFLRMEALNRKRKHVDTKVMRGVNAKIPIQPNHCDCGVYVLQFIETFFNDSDLHRDYILVFSFNKSHKADPDTWFNHKVIVQKRKRIQELIMNLAKEYAHSVDKSNIEAIALDDSDDDVQIVQ
jgi:Ulp1 family protease